MEFLSSSTPGARRAHLAFAWAARLVAPVAALLVAGMLLDYGNLVFIGVPFVDDWYFLDRLRAYRAGEVGLVHLLAPHNGHPQWPARLLLLASAEWQAIDLAALRWITLGTAFAAAAAASTAGWLVLTRGPAPLPSWEAGPALGSALTLLLAGSLGQWEIFTVALGIGSALVNLTSFVAIFAFWWWCERGTRFGLVLALAMAFVASVSMGQGMLIWPVLLGMHLLHPARRAAHAVGWLLLAAGVAVTVPPLFEAAASSQGQALLAGLRPGKTLYAALGLLGLPILGHVENRPVTPLTSAIGVGVLLLSGLGVARWSLAGPEGRRAMLPFLACMAFGGGTLLLILVARQAQPFEQFFASRYSAALAPLSVGLAGLLAVGARWQGACAKPLIVYASLVIFGVGVTAQQELRLASDRLGAATRMERLLIEGFEGLSDSDIAGALYTDEETAQVARRVREFLDEAGLSIFRPEGG